MTIADDRPDCVTCGASLTGAADVAYCKVCRVEAAAARWFTSGERYGDVLAATGVDDGELEEALERRFDRILAIVNRMCGLSATDTTRYPPP
jgi:hypothetical protein